MRSKRARRRESAGGAGDDMLKRGGDRSIRIPRPDPQLNDDDAFRRQVARANAAGGGADRCHGCGRVLASGTTTVLFGTDRRNRPLAVAECCHRRLTVILGYGVYLAAADAPAEWLAEVPARGSAPRDPQHTRRARARHRRRPRLARHRRLRHRASARQRLRVGAVHPFTTAGPGAAGFAAAARGGLGGRRYGSPL
jgi:hypothetical protein